MIYSEQDIYEGLIVSYDDNPEHYAKIALGEYQGGGIRVSATFDSGGIHICHLLDAVKYLNNGDWKLLNKTIVYDIF